MMILLQIVALLLFVSKTETQKFVFFYTIIQHSNLHVLLNSLNYKNKNYASNKLEIYKQTQF